METTKLSSKGQVIIPKSLRNTHHWKEGLEFIVIDTGDGVLLKPKAPFTSTVLTDVAGILKSKNKSRTDAEIDAALKADLRKKWRDSN
jgi:AbrB family looped-hinge helix DNA binding protein